MVIIFWLRSYTFESKYNKTTFRGSIHAVLFPAMRKNEILMMLLGKRIKNYHGFRVSSNYHSKRRGTYLYKIIILHRTKDRCFDCFQKRYMDDRTTCVRASLHYTYSYLIIMYTIYKYLQSYNNMTTVVLVYSISHYISDNLS